MQNQNKNERFDPAEFLYTQDEIADFLTEALELESGPKGLARCLDAAVRAQGLIDISAKSGIPVEDLYSKVRHCADLDVETAASLAVEIRDALRTQPEPKEIETKVAEGTMPKEASSKISEFTGSDLPFDPSKLSPEEIEAWKKRILWKKAREIAKTFESHPEKLASLKAQYKGAKGKLDVAKKKSPSKDKNKRFPLSPMEPQGNT